MVAGVAVVGVPLVVPVARDPALVERHRRRELPLGELLLAGPVRPDAVEDLRRRARQDRGVGEVVVRLHRPHVDLVAAVEGRVVAAVPVVRRVRRHHQPGLGRGPGELDGLVHVEHVGRDLEAAVAHVEARRAGRRRAGERDPPELVEEVVAGELVREHVLQRRRGALPVLDVLAAERPHHRRHHRALGLEVEDEAPRPGVGPVQREEAVFRAVAVVPVALVVPAAVVVVVVPARPRRAPLVRRGVVVAAVAVVLDVAELLVGLAVDPGVEMHLEPVAGPPPRVARELALLDDPGLPVVERVLPVADEREGVLGVRDVARDRVHDASHHAVVLPGQGIGARHGGAPVDHAAGVVGVRTDAHRQRAAPGALVLARRLERALEPGIAAKDDLGVPRLVRRDRVLGEHAVLDRPRVLSDEAVHVLAGGRAVVLHRLHLVDQAAVERLREHGDVAALQVAEELLHVVDAERPRVQLVVRLPRVEVLPRGAADLEVAVRRAEAVHQEAVVVDLHARAELFGLVGGRHRPVGVVGLGPRPLDPVDAQPHVVDVGRVLVQRHRRGRERRRVHVDLRPARGPVVLGRELEVRDEGRQVVPLVRRPRDRGEVPPVRVEPRQTVGRERVRHARLVGPVDLEPGVRDRRREPVRDRRRLPLDLARLHDRRPRAARPRVRRHDLVVVVVVGDRHRGVLREEVVHAVAGDALQQDVVDPDGLSGARPRRGDRRPVRRGRAVGPLDRQRPLERDLPVAPRRAHRPDERGRRRLRDVRDEDLLVVGHLALARDRLRAEAIHVARARRVDGRRLLVRLQPEVGRRRLAVRRAVLEHGRSRGRVERARHREHAVDRVGLVDDRLPRVVAHQLHLVAVLQARHRARVDVEARMLAVPRPRHRRHVRVHRPEAADAVLGEESQIRELRRHPDRAGNGGLLRPGEIGIDDVGGRESRGVFAVLELQVVHLEAAREVPRRVRRRRLRRDVEALRELDAAECIVEIGLVGGAATLVDVAVLVRQQGPVVHVDQVGVLPPHKPVVDDLPGERTGVLARRERRRVARKTHLVVIFERAGVDSPRSVGAERVLVERAGVDAVARVRAAQHVRHRSRGPVVLPLLPPHQHRREVRRRRAFPAVAHRDVELDGILERRIARRVVRLVLVDGHVGDERRENHVLNVNIAVLGFRGKSDCLVSDSKHFLLGKLNNQMKLVPFAKSPRWNGNLLYGLPVIIPGFPVGNASFQDERSGGAIAERGMCLEPNAANGISFDCVIACLDKPSFRIRIRRRLQTDRLGHARNCDGFGRRGKPPIVNHPLSFVLVPCGHVRTANRSHSVDRIGVLRDHEGLVDEGGLPALRILRRDGDGDPSGPAGRKRAGPVDAGALEVDADGRVPLRPVAVHELGARRRQLDLEGAAEQRVVFVVDQTHVVDVGHGKGGNGREERGEGEKGGVFHGRFLIGSGVRGPGPRWTGWQGVG